MVVQMMDGRSVSVWFSFLPYHAQLVGPVQHIEKTPISRWYLGSWLLLGGKLSSSGGPLPFQTMWAC